MTKTVSRWALALVVAYAALGFSPAAAQVNAELLVRIADRWSEQGVLGARLASADLAPLSLQAIQHQPSDDILIGTNDEMPDVAPPEIARFVDEVPPGESPGWSPSFQVRGRFDDAQTGLNNRPGRYGGLGIWFGPRGWGSNAEAALERVLGQD